MQKAYVYRMWAMSQIRIKRRKLTMRRARMMLRMLMQLIVREQFSTGHPAFKCDIRILRLVAGHQAFDTKREAARGKRAAITNACTDSMLSECAQFAITMPKPLPNPPLPRCKS